MVTQSLSVRNIKRMINVTQYNFLEQLIITEPVNFLDFVEPNMCCCIHTNPVLDRLQNQWNLVCTFTPYFFRSILILSPYLCLDKPSDVFSLAFSIKIVLAFLIPYI